VHRADTVAKDLSELLHCILLEWVSSERLPRSKARGVPRYTPPYRGRN
jgi:hypothetical protein